MEDMEKWAALQPICLECFKDKRMESTLKEIICLSFGSKQKKKQI